MPSLEEMRAYLMRVGMRERFIPTDKHDLVVLFLQKNRQIDYLNHPRHKYFSDNSNPRLVEKWNNVISLLELGSSDIYHYLSINVRKDCQDILLNYYNVYHFHHIPMGGVRQDKRLFVYITDNAAYILGEYPHGAESTMPLRLLQLLYKNWPDLFECREGTCDLTEQQIINIHSKHGNVFEYPLAPNIIGHLKNLCGITPSGHSIQDLIQADIICSTL